MARGINVYSAHQRRVCISGMKQRMAAKNSMAWHGGMAYGVKLWQQQRQHNAQARRMLRIGMAARQ